MRWLLVLLLIPMAGAWAEADAPALDPRVAEVGHSPEVPAPGTQWTGTIRFHEGHNITAVRYQICNVGTACFAGPTLAEQVDANTWRFDTSDYGPGGQAVEWGIYYPGESSEDWLVGVKYLLFTGGDGTEYEAAEPFPQGLDYESDECASMAWVDCDATHYITFPMPTAAAPGQDAPGLPVMLLVLALAVLARRR